VTDEAAFVRGPSGQPVALSGTVGRATAMLGSHSQHEVPILVDASGRRYRLLLIGENPMEQPTLRGLEGRAISLAGTWRNGVVRIDPADLRVEDESP